jgi:NDP-sugar pyrophosphorylase family protein
MDSAIGNVNYNHYQVVIIVDYDDGRLFPLTEETPKCLLPIANRKILGYQLDVLQSCGATGRCVYALCE